MRLYDNDEYREEFMALVYHLLSSDGTNERANQIITCFDMAPEVEAELVPKNDPLTIEELREMDGEPVWIKAGDLGCKGKWGLVSCWNGPTGGKFAVYIFDAKTGPTLYPNQEYGRCWRAYRRKPEEDHKDR